MTLSATKMRRCALAAALGTGLLASGAPGLAAPMPLADFSLDGNQASWMPKENSPYDHIVLTLVASPENERVCCDEPVGPEGVTVNLDEWGTGPYKYELYAVPPGQSNKAPTGGGQGPIDENGRSASVVQSRARAPRAERRSPVQSGYFTYGVDAGAEE